MPPSFPQYSSESTFFFLRTWLLLSNFSLLQLVYILSLAPAFFLFLSPLHIPLHWQLTSTFITLWLFTLPINTAKCLCFRAQSLSQEAACQGLSPSSSTHASPELRAGTLGKLLASPCFLPHSCDMGMTV